MKKLRERQLISIIFGGKLRRGRIRGKDPDASNPEGLYLDLRGTRIDLCVLTPETEGVKWARGWNGKEAKALATAHALSDPEPTLDAGKNLLAALAKTFVANPGAVLGVANAILDTLVGEKPSKSKPSP